MDSSGELFFIRHDISGKALSQGYRWSLSKMKVGGKVGGAYVAFRSYDAALLNANRSPGAMPVAITDLNGQCYFDFSNAAILVFESAEEYLEFLRSGGNYPYDQHLYMYSSEIGLRKIQNE